MNGAAQYAKVLEVAEREGVDGMVRVADGRVLLPELAGLERTLLSVARAAPGVAARAASHLVEAGGKRLRPSLLLLCARAFGEPRGEVLELAAVGELIHSATLLHDDVIDDGAERRHLPTSRILWGNAVSVLAGDFLLTRALELVRRAEIPSALPTLLDTLDRMVAAEISQLALRGRLDVRESEYWEVVEGKTASLFGWCARMGALSGGATPAQAEHAYRFAFELGVAFQVVDDLIDFEGTPDVAGKSVGRDLAEGKLTLPVLRALQVRPELGEQLRAVDAPEALGRALQATGVASRVRAEATRHLETGMTSLAAFPDSPTRPVLETIARAVVDRRS